MKWRTNRSGERFGKMLVLRRLDDYYYECKCDCGKVWRVHKNNIAKMHGCGCDNGKWNITHGESKTKLYTLWSSIKNRCRHEPKYAGRGIKLCEEWETFENFRDWAIANGYDENADFQECTIDRIDNYKGYSPDNCRFISMLENARNKRHHNRFDFDGELLTAREIAERMGMNWYTLITRLKRGWTIERATSEPIRKVEQKWRRM